MSLTQKIRAEQLKALKLSRELRELERLRERALTERARADGWAERLFRGMASWDLPARIALKRRALHRAEVRVTELMWQRDLGGEL